MRKSKLTPEQIVQALRQAGSRSRRPYTLKATASYRHHGSRRQP